ncbi:hypothetical protein QCA50_004054 [Cerrena zonata]|uniref:Uncharacterized protein n=1 Tax=Cerrena zonata TaxID=2478898 RepID=A0AAW0GKV8_9APHY
MPQSTTGELKSGAYFITSCATNLSIARKFVEDKQVVEDLYNHPTSKPVRVVTLPEDSHDLAWDFQEIEPRKFILRSRGIPTHLVEGGVGASIVYAPLPTLWRVRQAVENGENAYLITTEDGQKGWWTAGEEPGSAVEIRPLPPAVDTTDLLTGSVNHFFRLTPVR